MLCALGSHADNHRSPVLVRSEPESGSRRPQLPCRLRVDPVEKVLAGVGTKFLRAADAFNAVRHGGPHRLEQKLSATFFFA
jgi:hypothetical protein